MGWLTLLLGEDGFLLKVVVCGFLRRYKTEAETARNVVA